VHTCGFFRYIRGREKGDFDEINVREHGNCIFDWNLLDFNDSKTAAVCFKNKKGQEGLN
jgi:hypothetical protein